MVTVIPCLWWTLDLVILIDILVINMTQGGFRMRDAGWKWLFGGRVFGKSRAIRQRHSMSCWKS